MHTLSALSAQMQMFGINGRKMFWLAALLHSHSHTHSPPFTHLNSSPTVLAFQRTDNVLWNVFDRSWELIETRATSISQLSHVYVD
jgi:hypothetical protein